MFIYLQKFIYKFYYKNYKNYKIIENIFAGENIFIKKVSKKEKINKIISFDDLDDENDNKLMNNDEEKEEDDDDNVNDKKEEKKEDKKLNDIKNKLVFTNINF